MISTIEMTTKHCTSATIDINKTCQNSDLCYNHSLNSEIKSNDPKTSNGNHICKE